MNHIYTILISLIALQIDLVQGLRFKDNTQPINQRTSYNVFDQEQIEFTDHFDIQFDLSMYATQTIGYIFRIKDEKSSMIYNLFFEEVGDELSLRFNKEGVRCLATAMIKKSVLYDNKWIKIQVRFDLRNQTIILKIHDQTFNLENAELPPIYRPTIIFGKSDYIIDVPSFSIKSLMVGNENAYYFGLNESTGTEVHDQNGYVHGKVDNPEWLINDAYYWRLKKSLTSQSVAGANYDVSKKIIYYFSNDTIYFYNTNTNDTRYELIRNECPVRLTLGTSFIDTTTNKLYAYEVYFDPDKVGPTVASLDLNTFLWQTESYDRLPTQLHHHGHYFDANQHEFFLFGGFGNKRYSNHFYGYNTVTNHWEEALIDLTGDFIAPRYFVSLGHSQSEQSIYIFGGMGNESGDQTVGRKYMYDLHKVDLKTHVVTKLWEIPWTQEDMVPVRRMILMDSSFYTLVYPEHYTDSFLKLYKFSLKDGSYKILGDSIPIHSDKINTNANLFYDESQSSLYALILEFEDDIASELKIYSIAFPSITANDLIIHTVTDRDSSTERLIIILIVCSCLAGGAGYWIIRKQRAKKEKLRYGSSDSHKPFKEEIKSNSIFLFGNFTVFNKKGKDISYLFSARLTEMFCIIMQHSTSGGINTKKLSNILWPDKEGEKLKNSRGVTINNLRKVLSELDGIDLIYENGNYLITTTPALYCDFFKLMEFIPANITDSNREDFIDIVTRGKFLNHLNEPIFDAFKISTERKLEPVLILEIEKCFNAGYFHATISLANALFNIDPLNDAALEYLLKALQQLDKKEEALIRYNEFLIKYKDTMKQDYPKHIKL